VNTGFEELALPVVEDYESPKSSRTPGDLLELGRNNGLDFRSWGIWPKPKNRVRLEKWELVPAHLDESDIPSWVMQRVRQIQEAGFRPDGYLIAHELILPTIKTRHEAPPISMDTEKILKTVMGAITFLVTIVVAITGVILAALGGLLIVGLLALPLALFGVMGVDPVYCLLFKVEGQAGDGSQELYEYIEIARWDNQ
jgi:hypothetical protein